MEMWYLHKSLSWSARWMAFMLTWGLICPAIGIPRSTSTADHRKFDILKQEFKTGPAVTAACLGCHTEAAVQVHQSIHWTWEYTHRATSQRLGKKYLINAFCGSAVSNKPHCTSCHAGYGWQNSDFDFTSETSVDCLVCHDQTGVYRKFPTAAGHPIYEPREYQGEVLQPPDLSYVARNVGLSKRDNCGACHFYGGGGDGVKHGDLDSSLIDPSFDLDVHMSAGGADFVCTDCHKGSGHQWPGSHYRVTARDRGGTGRPGERREATTCESCHGLKPHTTRHMGALKALRLNNHGDRIACQTCHIPEFARGGIATRTFWDWSRAGQLDKDGKPFAGHLDASGMPVPGRGALGYFTFITGKGAFEYRENIVPNYYWFNGNVYYTLPAEKIDDTRPVAINRFSGAYDDQSARIWPFKVMRGRQPYDTRLKNLVYAHIYGPDNDLSHWKDFDWLGAIRIGMQESGIPFSGEFDFIDTVMYWPITHMVAPAEKALDCASCHSADGRLKDLGGFYLPGRDQNPLLDKIGLFVMGLAMLGVVGHAGLRILCTWRRRRQQ